MKKSTTVSTAATATAKRVHYGHVTDGFDREDAYRLLRQLLSEAGLRACRVEPDPVSDGWHVFALQSTDAGAWRTFNLSVDNASLRRAGTDVETHQRLVTQMATSLAERDAAN
jgi:hypothetical protein